MQINRLACGIFVSFIVASCSLSTKQQKSAEDELNSAIARVRANLIVLEALEDRNYEKAKESSAMLVWSSAKVLLDTIDSSEQMQSVDVERAKSILNEVVKVLKKSDYDYLEHHLEPIQKAAEK